MTRKEMFDLRIASDGFRYRLAMMLMDFVMRSEKRCLNAPNFRPAPSE